MATRRQSTFERPYLESSIRAGQMHSFPVNTLVALRQNLSETVAKGDRIGIVLGESKLPSYGNRGPYLEVLWGDGQIDRVHRESLVLMEGQL